jgi:hypothetical protein
MERTLVARLRWWVANQVNRLSGQCWAGLVSWALDGPRSCRRRGDNPLPWRPISDTCRLDAAENAGCCLCSKIRTPTPVPAATTGTTTTGTTTGADS